MNEELLGFTKNKRRREQAALPFDLFTTYETTPFKRNAVGCGDAQIEKNALFSSNWSQRKAEVCEDRLFDSLPWKTFLIH